MFVQIVLGQQVSSYHSFNCQQQATTKMHLVLRFVLLFNKWSGSLFSKRPQLEVSPLRWLSLNRRFISYFCCQRDIGGQMGGEDEDRCEDLQKTATCFISVE